MNIYCFLLNIYCFLLKIYCCLLNIYCFLVISGENGIKIIFSSDFFFFSQKGNIYEELLFEEKNCLIIVYVPREKSDLRKSQIDRTLRQTDDI